MQIELESSLRRWTDAGLVDVNQADRIKEFESRSAPQRGGRLPIFIGLALGGVMLMAGVLLFVSAHWEELSPTQRMTLLVSAVGAFHMAGAFCAERFRAMAITLHAIGTVALGGAIFLAGQVFNLQEHWPTGVLLWAAGALAGWLLLGDWPQLVLTAILAPSWLISEWMDGAPYGSGRDLVASAGVTLLAICYLSARCKPVGDSAAARALAWIGGLALIPSVLVLALDRLLSGSNRMQDSLLVTGWATALLIPLAIAFLFRRQQVWMNGVAAVWVGALSWMVAHDLSDKPITYLWCGLGAAGMIAWGLYESRAERVNLGMAGFALTVACFFFSNVMDKLGRSASLIALGVMFLAGGWYWEKLRRRLVRRAIEGGVQ